MKTLQIVAVCSLVAALAGCGSSGTSPAPTATTASVSGSVADGYLVNATVFLDKDRDFVQDPEEPYATTDGAGKYTLVVATADIGKYPVVALAKAGTTIDLDDPTKTVADSYLLCMPAASLVTTESGLSGTVDSNFISPISTLVQERMAADPALTLEAAVALVRSELGLPAGANPLGNYLQGANANAQLHTMAQEMVRLMMEQRSQIMQNANGTGVDPLKYRSMVQTMSQNMQQLYQNVTAEPAVQAAFRTTMRDRIQAGFVR